MSEKPAPFPVMPEDSASNSESAASTPEQVPTRDGDEPEVIAEAQQASADAPETPASATDTPVAPSAAGAQTTADIPSMAELLQQTTNPPVREVSVGDRVRGKVVSIGAEQTFVDFGGRAEAVIATSELRGRDGEVMLREGDPLTATVSVADETVVLTLGKRRGAIHAARLRLAFERGIPVSGTVRAVNKGGFDVNVGGIRAFCPLSQIDMAFVEDPSQHVGKRYVFKVLRWEKNGRNIVVSRRGILKEQSAAKAAETRKTLAVDSVFDGTVTRVQPFGAFVDIGGIEGLLHVSRMSHSHIVDPKTVVTAGGQVRVRVIGVENAGTKKERVSLALEDLGPDPFETATASLQVGQVVHGKVSSLTPFGAFVSLDAGVDGLVHISELAYKKVNDPREVVALGDEVDVRVLRIEGDKRRISLSLKQASEPPPRPRTTRRDGRGGKTHRPQPAPVASTTTGPLTHTMADQLGAVRKKLRQKG